MLTDCTADGLPKPPFTYSISLDDGSTLPSFISFDESTWKLTIDSPSIYDIGTYTVKILGTLPTPIYGVAFITINISGNLQAPYFLEELPNPLLLKQCIKSTYTLPSIIDSEGDNIKNPLIFLGETLLFAKYIESSKFFKFEPTFMIKPKIYKIKIVLEDMNKFPLKKEIAMNILVEENPDCHPQIVDKPKTDIENRTDIKTDSFKTISAKI